MLFVAGSLPGLALTHPGAFVAWLFASSLALVFAVVLRLRSRPGRRSVLVVLAFTAVWAGVAFAVWRLLRPPLEARGWPITETIGQALGESVTMTMYGSAIPVVLVFFLWVGVVAAIRTRRSTDVFAIAAIVVFVVLYVAASAFPWGNLRDLLTAAWYNNAPRLAALIPLLAIPLAALGVSTAVSTAESFARRRSLSTRVTAATIAGVAVVLVAGTQVVAVRDSVVAAGGVYRVTPGSALVSSDELALIEKLPDVVPADAVIAGNPWTGAGLAYALADRRVLMPHLLMDVSPDMKIVNDELAEADEDPEVCSAVEATHVEYLLDFGDREVHGAAHPFPGFADAATSPSLRLVDSVGSARLYEVTACDR